MSGWYYLARWVAVALISALALGDGPREPEPVDWRETERALGLVGS